MINNNVNFGVRTNTNNSMSSVKMNSKNSVSFGTRIGPQLKADLLGAAHVIDESYQETLIALVNDGRDDREVDLKGHRVEAVPYEPYGRYIPDNIYYVWSDSLTLDIAGHPLAYIKDFKRTIRTRDYTPETIEQKGEFVLSLKNYLSQNALDKYEQSIAAGEDVERSLIILGRNDLKERTEKGKAFLNELFSQQK